MGSALAMSRSIPLCEPLHVSSYHAARREADLMVGLFGKGIETNGTDAFRGVQAAIGEIIVWRNSILGMTADICHEPESATGGTAVPWQEYANTMRLFCTHCRPAVRHIFEKVLGGSLLMSHSRTGGPAFE